MGYENSFIICGVSQKATKNKKIAKIMDGKPMRL